MQNNIFSKVNVSARILMLVLLTFSLLINSSIYFIIFLTNLFIILFLLTNKSVKFYVDLIKNVMYWLLFVYITYIIIVGNILESFVFIYKIILILLFFKQFSLTTNFYELINGIKTLLKIFDKIINLDKTSCDIAVFIYIFKFYIESKKEILEKYSIENKLKYLFSLKYNVFPRLFNTMYRINNLESSIRLKHYNPKFEVNNIESKIGIYSFTILFIIVVFKEVVL